MAASQNDNFLQAAPNWVGAIGAGGVSDGVVTTVPLVSSTSLPTTTGIQLTIDRVDANGNATPSKMEVVMGVVSGTNLISCLRGVEGTAQAHSAGAVVEYMLTADMWNQQANTLLIGHNQDGTHILDTDGTLAANSDTHIASQKAVKTYADRAQNSTLNVSPLFAPEGFLINGKIVPTVASNNITLTLQTLAGANPSATDMVYCRINGVIRSITSALSVTIAAGANTFNMGSTELATKEVDLFAVMGYNATDGVTLGATRIPYATCYGDFSATATNEKYCAISSIAHAASTDYYNVIGRFAATLGVSATYYWTVPAYTSINLIQRPIFETRTLLYTPTFTGFSAAPVGVYSYRIIGRTIFINQTVTGAGTSNATGFTVTLPFILAPNINPYPIVAQDNGALVLSVATGAGASTNVLTFCKGASTSAASWTASSSKYAYMQDVPIQMP